MKRLVLWGVVLLLSLPIAAHAQVVPIPTDAIAGQPIREENLIGEKEYKDDSIHVKLVDYIHENIPCTIAYVTIEDPSQLRTAMSSDKPDDHRYVRGYLMAKKANAIVAINGDFFKYTHTGYTVRQGKIIRELPDGNHDVLLIDDAAQFTVLRNADMPAIETYLLQLPKERKLVNSFNFGPLLVENGQAQPITIEMYQPNARHQRVAIVQISAKEYALVHCMGAVKNKKNGLTLEEFADFIAKTIPDCQIAYNLDGGGSAHMLFMTKRLNANDGLRDISDIVYFASAYQSDEAVQ